MKTIGKILGDIFLVIVLDIVIMFTIFRDITASKSVFVLLGVISLVIFRRVIKERRRRDRG